MRDVKEQKVNSTSKKRVSNFPVPQLFQFSFSDIIAIELDCSVTGDVRNLIPDFSHRFVIVGCFAEPALTPRPFRPIKGVDCRVSDFFVCHILVLFWNPLQRDCWFRESGISRN